MSNPRPPLPPQEEEAAGATEKQPQEGDQGKLDDTWDELELMTPRGPAAALRILGMEGRAVWAKIVGAVYQVSLSRTHHADGTSFCCALSI